MKAKQAIIRRNPRICTTNRCVQTIHTTFFQDESTGEWGITPTNTIDPDESFNAFWNGVGIFHDVFEHNFEHMHYFQKQYAMNIGGEIAAMGAMWYYMREVCVWNRNTWSSSDPTSTQTKAHIIHRILSFIEPAIQEGWFTFGDRLESNVPPHRRIDGDINFLGDFLYSQIQQLTVETKNESKERSELYKKSFTLQKIKNLFHWGYTMAKKLVPLSTHNTAVLYRFVDKWEHFTKENPAQQLNDFFEGITFRIYHQPTHKSVLFYPKEPVEVFWSATLNGIAPNTDRVLQEDTIGLFRLHTYQKK